MSAGLGFDIKVKDFVDECAGKSCANCGDTKCPWYDNWLDEEEPDNE